MEMHLLDATLGPPAASPKHKRDADDFRAALAASKLEQQHDGLPQSNPSPSTALTIIQTMQSDALPQGNPSPSTRINAVIQAAQEAAHRLTAGQSWDDWKAVGRALQVVRTQAMAEARTNKPEGKHYAAAFGRLLSDAKLDKLVGGNEHKALRSRLLDLIDHIDDVEKWRSVLPLNRRLELNYPRTIWQHWQHSKIPINNNSEKPPSLVAKLKENIAALEEENTRLKQLNGGNTLLAKDTARDVVRLLQQTYPESKLKEIRRLLGKADEPA
jgi:hypothetical protein